MIKSYGLKFPHWLLYESVATIYVLLRMIITEDQRWAKLIAMVKGTIDGILGRMGPPYWTAKTLPPSPEKQVK
jgi:hypothetical protein